MTKTKVLVWLDNGLYTYQNYSICLSLKELGDYEFFGVVATKSEYNFLKNQQDLTFTELHYYPDCYINKSSYDLDYLLGTEKKFGLNLWLDIYGERMFHRHRTHFHKFTKSEILVIIENTIKLFVDLLTKIKPDFIIMQTAGENVANILLYKIAHFLGVKSIMINFTHMHNQVIISDNLINREITNEFQKRIQDSTRIKTSINETFEKNLGLSETVKVMSTFNFDTDSSSQKIKRYFKRLVNDPEPVYQNIGKTKTKMLSWKINSYFELNKRKKFLDDNALKTIPNEKFIYFPLHTEPEAKILATSPFFSNQLATIENVARSIPIDCVLYVKEHPGQAMKLWRSVDYYKKIIEMPNVELIHPTVNSQDLIAKSVAVISITGSTGFEALFYQKPVILFADEFYDTLSMVKKVEKITDLPYLIKNAIESYKFQQEELNTLIQSINQISISIPYAEIMRDALVVASVQRVGNPQNSIESNFANFYKKYKQHFDLIAKEYKSKTL